MKKLLFGLLLLALFAFIGVRFAEPVGDADLFWQMAYGRYMVDHMTLVPDHTVFSWTPSTNATIYCSWVAEIFFYLAYQAAGLPLLFAFRYACIFLSVWLLFDYARRLTARQPELRLTQRPELYFYTAVMLLGCYVGTILKPEIFSFVAFHLLAWGYFTMKLETRDAQAAHSQRWLIYFPVLMLVWVNSHGVFMFGLAALIILCVGEWLNRVVSPELALPMPALKRFTLATGLSAVACFITPYGYRYPLQLVNELVGMLSGGQSAGDAAAYAALAAHRGIMFAPAFHFVPIMVVMVLCLLWFWGLQATQAGPGKRLDVAVVGVNVAMGLVYFWYLRTTYYWPPFAFYSCLYGLFVLQQSNDRARTWIRARMVPGLLSAVAFLLVCTGSMVQSIWLPYACSWCGFGISLWNPEYEAEWLERFDPQARIYNDYDGGGYLLWKLYPKTKVMIDPRSFPYRAWYADYSRFEQGEIHDELLDSWPQSADIAVVSSKNQALWRRFASSGKWVVAWVGPNSVIFCRPNRKYPSDAASYAQDRFRYIKSFPKAIDTFSMCIDLGLYDNAFAVLRGMSQNFGRLKDERDTIEGFTVYKEALEAEMGEVNKDKAMVLHEKARSLGICYNDQRLMDLYKWKLATLVQGNQKGKNDLFIRELAVKMSAINRGEGIPNHLNVNPVQSGGPKALPSP